MSQNTGGQGSGGQGYGPGYGQEKSKDRGTHYHYHFYGAGAAPGYDPAAAQPGPQAYPQQGYVPPQGPGGPGFPGAAPGWPFAPVGAAPAGAGQGFGPGFGQAGANQHAHPRADSLVKGIAVGAGVAWLATNETVQRAVLRTAFQLWAAVQGGVAEFKERMHDAEAEAEAAAAAVHPAEAAAAEAEIAEPPAKGAGPRSVSN